MHHILELGVAFPLLAFTAIGQADIIAADVAGHEGQAGNSQFGEVIVVAGLPGALVGTGEVVDLHEVDQVRVGTVDVRESGIA
ncbi:hypothetical protein D3C76_1369130 [compost metagenome]